MIKQTRIFTALLMALSVSACSATAPEALSPKIEQAQIKLGNTAMVVTANPLASRAGAEILRAGGSAVDAAIAIEAVLSLVEPQSSGLGGGGYMTHFDNASNIVSVYDGRETAPALATEKMFLDQEGNSIGYLNAKNSGLSTGVPGMVSMLSLAHQDHGKIPWGPHFDRLSNQNYV